MLIIIAILLLHNKASLTREEINVILTARESFIKLYSRNSIRKVTHGRFDITKGRADGAQITNIFVIYNS